jgi:hypothetical protein
VFHDSRDKYIITITRITQIPATPSKAFSGGFAALLPQLRGELHLLKKKGSLVKLAFRALSTLKEHNIASFSRIEGPWQDWLRSQQYATITKRSYTLVKLVLHVNGYVRAMGLEEAPIASLGYDTDEEVAAMHLRRLLERLLGGKIYHHGQLLEPAVEVSQVEDTLENRILDANNRFSVLFEMWDDNSPTLVVPEKNIRYGGPKIEPSIDELRYHNQALANATRKRMGYKPKGTASVESKEFHEVDTKCKRREHLRHLKYRVSVPLMEWRKEYLIPRDAELTIVPITLLGVYEHWYEGAKGLFVPHPLPPSYGWDVPRVWDTGGGEKPSPGAPYCLSPQ